MDVAMLIVCLILFTGLVFIGVKFVRLRRELKAVLREYSPIIDIRNEAIKLRTEFDKEINDKKNELTKLAAEYSENRELFIKLSTKLSEVTDSLSMIEYGVYEPIFDYHDSISFQNAIQANKEKQKEYIKSDNACIYSANWTVNGSKREGATMIKRYIKLILRAFNSECDATISKVKVGNISQLEKRIQSSFEALNKFGKSMDISISNRFLGLRLEELKLCHEKELKIQEEKDILREERELQREEEKAQKEYERAIKEEQKAELSYQKAMAQARKELEKSSQEEREKINKRISELERELEEARSLSERAKSQAQLTRSGHVYIISNIGAFGKNVYKIGLTRRLEPEERVNELGSASVPFKFDIHALIYSNDAPSLEAALHQEFSDYRINLVNNRKEFFNVPIEKIEQKIKELGFDASFEHFAKAHEYRATLSLLEKSKMDWEPKQTIKDKIASEFPEMVTA